jgi:hypothetical protein
MRLKCFQMLTTSNESYVFARSGQLRAKISTCATSAVDRNAHLRPFEYQLQAVCYQSSLSNGMNL